MSETESERGRKESTKDKKYAMETDRNHNKE